MGEFADEAFDRAMEEEWEYDSLIGDILECSNEELIRETAGARFPLVMSIRKYWKEHWKLSDKQRYCLARWIANSERSAGYGRW